MKNRITLFIISGLILLAALGITSSVIANPAGFLKRIAVILVVGAVIFYIFKRIMQSNPAKNEHQAFVRAAKKSKKRYLKMENKPGNKRKSSIGSLSSLKRQKRKSTAQLTVIEGRKGKKKDRASL